MTHATSHTYGIYVYQQVYYEVTLRDVDDVESRGYRKLKKGEHRRSYVYMMTVAGSTCAVPLLLLLCRCCIHGVHRLDSFMLLFPQIILILCSILFFILPSDNVS